MAEGSSDQPTISVESLISVDARTAFNIAVEHGQDLEDDPAQEKVFFYFWERSADFRTLFAWQRMVRQQYQLILHCCLC